MMTILLVEDDDNVREPTQELLSKSNFRVLTASDLRQATAQLEASPDLVVLDWNLPDGEGLKWLVKKREEGFRKPVILLTARTDLVDRVIGLEFGANDYMTKPFEPRELVARIHAHLRTDRQTSAKNDRLRLGNLSLNTSTHEVLFNANPVHLTPTEYEVLKFLMERAEQVCTREEITEAVWQTSPEQESRALDNCILQLRKKVPEYIQTVRNVGYKLKVKE